MDDLGVPSIFRVGEAAAQAVTAAHREAAAFLAVRNGLRDVPEAAVPVREAVAAFRSERYLRVGGEPVWSWGPLSGDYRTADGWIRLHCNFEHHAEIACRALGIRPEAADPERVAAAVAGRDKEELEDAITRAGGVAAAMRTREEWLAHPASVASRDAGSGFGRRISDAGRTAETSPSPSPADRPLAGVRVLDLTRIIAGPVAGRTLAGYGADVTMVRAAHLPTIRALDLDFGFGKGLVLLDLRTEEGREAFLGMVREADVVLQSYRPGALAKLGLGAEDLARVRPGLVHVSVSAYGPGGPWAAKRGFDSLVQMVSGIADEAARAAGSDRPVPLPAQVLDHLAGWTAAAEAIRALGRVRAGDGSWAVEVSLAQMAHQLDALGRVDPAVALAVPDQTAEDVADLMLETRGRSGLLTHVRMPGSIAGVELGWDSPPPFD